MGKPLLILGDLVNLSDYRTGEGAIGEVLGVEFAQRSAASRAAGDYEMMRGLWSSAVGDDADGVRAAIGEAIIAQYAEVGDALIGATGYAIHGNVDRPRYMREILPEDLQYVHGQVVDIDGVRIGFAGGGVATPLQAEGEVSDDEMKQLLGRLGKVDVLCTHVPPALPPLRTDVITGRSERGSEPILAYLRDFQPKLHLFGDVHQPQASTWRVGRTLCKNVGYFRATGRPTLLDLARWS